MATRGPTARVRQNLALVVGLQGRFAEAETIAKGDLPADEAATNVAYLREMLSRKDKDNSRARQQSRSGRCAQSAGLSTAAVIPAKAGDPIIQSCSSSIQASRRRA